MVQFSKEPNNLYNINSFKHSQKNPSSLVHKTVMKKEFSIMAKTIANQVSYLNPLLLLFVM
ncbi:hypothetical protein MKX03_012550 [Papaver bracteatum]|nr:hypothetical protein MKX03_018738 [Papaver bracteatum]KAI3881578.1 hypothetical protein MKX03_012550 [Papaver bracteatum]